MKKCSLGSNLKFKGKTLSGFLIFFPVCVFFFYRTVYDRVPHLAPYQRTMLTYTVSTIWHGFYPGYYLTFLNAVLIIVATRTVSKHKWMLINLVTRGKEMRHLKPWGQGWSRALFSDHVFYQLSAG